MLDEFAGLAQRAHVAEAFPEWQRLQSELDAFQMDEREKAARLDLLTFQLGELEKASVRPARTRNWRPPGACSECRETAAALRRGVLALYDSDDAALARSARCGSA